MENCLPDTGRKKKNNQVLALYLHFDFVGLHLFYMFCSGSLGAKPYFCMPPTNSKKLLLNYQTIPSMKLKFNSLVWLTLLWLLPGAAIAQQRNPVFIAQEYVRSHHAAWGLTAQDIEGMTVSDNYTDPTTGISRVYFLQRHQGIPVYNAIQNLSITPDGKVFHVGKRFIARLAEKVNTTVPVLSAEQAVKKLMAHLALPAGTLRLADRVGDTEFIFEKGNTARENIKAKLSYQRYHDLVLLAWDIALFPVKSSDMWSVRMDAVTGSVLDKTNWTVYCKVDANEFRHIDHDCQEEAANVHEAMTYNFPNLGTTNNPEVNSGRTTNNQQSRSEFGMNAPFAAGASYNVWPMPYESPSHGPRTLVTDPADPSASPHGWHDTNGQPGAEFTITRGNNVHAYEDSGNKNTSIGNEPNGGPGLTFDFPFDPSWEPVQYKDAATVNLFYWNNIMHDFSYAYGFTEVAGNFQANNYGKGGQGNDYVQAEAQDGFGTNNANFGTPADGGNGRMQMFLWGVSSASYLTVNEPAIIAGGYTTILPSNGTTTWGAGAIPTATPVKGSVIIADDGVADPYTSDACQPLLNASALSGKIALIDRGECQFGFKALAAQNAGAIAVIICDIPGATPTAGLAAGDYGGQVNIPVVMISVSDCQTIRQYAGNGLVVTLQQPQGGGPTQLDGDLDNGIVAHEYAHGISNRLTGGPSQAGCLGNAEQMGEGWSDFFTLITSVKSGDAGEKSRGIGTYVFGQSENGRGIRNYPYSTDMDVNPWTYGGVASNREEHYLGEFWTAMLWDLYWRMVDEYGWDEDLYFGTGGNNMATRLVFDGMKNQPCEPGFIDGRDAILAADKALYGSANQCLIWEVFARRGAGFSADQGSSTDAGDQTEAFDIPCSCRKAVSITKSVTDLVNAGDDIQVTLNVSNCKQQTVTNMKVFDDLPNGVTFKAGSANVPATVEGGQVVFDLGNMPFEGEKTITYSLTTSPDNYSLRYFFDDVPTEEAEDNWEYYYVGKQSPNIWSIQDALSNSPEFAWSVDNIDDESIQALELITPWKVTGDRPVLRFYHRYDTESGADGGVVDIKEVGASSWTQVPDKMLRNGYPGTLQYGTFAFPLKAFSGNSGPDFIATYIDLSDWAGKEIIIRFRFGTDDNTPGPLGWVVDDIEFMDLFNYQGQACIRTDQGDNVCTFAPEEGTIIESQLPPTGIVEKLQDVNIAIYPNPARDVLHVALSSEKQREVSISMLTVEGREVMTRAAQVFGQHQLGLNVSNLPGGFYFVKMSTGAETVVRKVVIE
jgi:uncharacterized repeat protein (TIGR01451 family)